MAARFVVDILREVDADRSAAGRYAALLTGPYSPVAPRLVGVALADALTDVLAAVLRAGWGPLDLAEIAARRLSARHLPLLAALLGDETGRHPGSCVAAPWREQLSRLGPPEPADLRSAEGVETALELCAMLMGLPVIAELLPPPGSRAASPAATGADTKLLGRVRSLLAKAESTDFPEEAEALSAKAQELISRYSLDRLVHEAGPHSVGSPVTARRLWIDAPYVIAKAMLVDAVASANRCRSVVAEQLGFSTVIGDPADLELVDLLVTSLLVQANTAMLRHGRQADRSGATRTASFRRSFLIAYAGRIRERLHSTDQDAVENSGRVGELVPMLRKHGEHVEAAMEAMFPQLVSRQTSISNSHGWAAGRAAADQALLDTSLAVTEAAS